MSPIFKSWENVCTLVTSLEQFSLICHLMYIVLHCSIVLDHKECYTCFCVLQFHCSYQGFYGNGLGWALVGGLIVFLVCS